MIFLKNLVILNASSGGHRAAHCASMQRRVIDQTKQRHRRYSPEAYVGHSRQAQEIRQLLVKLAQVPFGLIIGGEAAQAGFSCAHIALWRPARDSR
jgi:hypothetical protein